MLIEFKARLSIPVYMHLVHNCCCIYNDLTYFAVYNQGKFSENLLQFKTNAGINYKCKCPFLFRSKK